MKKLYKGLSIIVFCTIISGAFTFSYAQQSIKIPAPIDWKAVSDWKLKVEAHPDSLGYHTGFIKSIGWDGNLFILERDFKSRYDSAEAILDNQYRIWATMFPTIPAVHYAIGSAFYEHESPKATAYLKKVVELDAKNADALFKLSIDAERWGNGKAASDYMKFASEADPANPAYLFYYAANFRRTNLDFYREKVQELVKLFPAHERAAQGLYWLAYETKERERKIKIYEELRSKFPPEKFNWSESGMYGLFDQYLFSQQFDKANDLAQSLVAKRGWSEMQVFAKSISVIQKYMDSGNYKVAYDSILKLKLAKFTSYQDKVVMIEADLADRTGNSVAGYEKLLKKHAKEPTDELARLLKVYSEKIGKDETEVAKNILAIRDNTKKPAYPFELGLYTSNSKLALSDLKGKVVLLTFWFPGCGPCRAEFPHFESVVNKYDKKKVAYIGINVFPNQDDYVLPFMKSTQYSFTPLKSTSAWAEKHFGVRGQPTNFLLDKEGNIVFANFRTDQHNERTLEMMIESLL